MPSTSSATPRADRPALIARAEGGPVREVSWAELQRDTAAFAARLRQWGVAPGDRVASYLPNRTETVVAFLACASIGAVWSSCAPDMGPGVVLDRLRQIEPSAAAGHRQHALQRQDAGPRDGRRRTAARAAERKERGACRQGRSHPSGRPPGATARPGPTRSRPMPSSSTRACRSSTRCGSCTRRAPPACPRRWCMAMAASCSRTSRHSSCNTTCAPVTACFFSAAPAGSSGTCRSGRCSRARRSCCTTATRRGPTSRRCGDSSTSTA